MGWGLQITGAPRAAEQVAAEGAPAGCSTLVVWRMVARASEATKSATQKNSRGKLGGPPRATVQRAARGGPGQVRRASSAAGLVAGGLAAGADGLGAVVAVSLEGLQVLLALSKVVLGLLRRHLGINQLVAAVRQVPYTNNGRRGGVEE